MNEPNHSRSGFPPVDLVVNCFERTYRSVLSPGFFGRIERDNDFRFAHRTVLINNANDLPHAERLAHDLVAAGEIDDFFLVDNLLDGALKQVCLSRKALGPLPFYSNWALAALAIRGSDYMVHWDAEIVMSEQANWITPSLHLMQSDSRIAVANPLWRGGESAPEFRKRAEGFALGYGFTDQVYLLRRSEFLRPIYHHWVPISLRYPVSHIAPYFEQWVDAYLRVCKRLRATYLHAHYEHPPEEGAAYPGGPKARINRLRNRMLVKAMRKLPGKHPYFHD